MFAFSRGSDMAVMWGGQCCHGDAYGGGYVYGRRGYLEVGGGEGNGDAGSAGNNLCRMNHKLRICGSFLGKISSLSLLLTPPPVRPANNSPARLEVSAGEWLRADTELGTKILCTSLLHGGKGVTPCRCPARLQVAQAPDSEMIRTLMK